jgi:arylsulfatase A
MGLSEVLVSVKALRPIAGRLRDVSPACLRAPLRGAACRSDRRMATPTPDCTGHWNPLQVPFMKPRTIKWCRQILLVLLFSKLAIISPEAATAASKPNIIIILADDLGYGDLGCYGHPTIRSPNLDRMAAEGMRFTQFYSAGEVCTPSRAALMTGRLPIRNGMCHDQFRVLRAQSTGGLPAGEITMAQAVKSQGYATAAIGKWHLGNWMNDPAHHPRRHGFDFYFGLPHSNDMNPRPGAPKGMGGRLDQDANWWNAPLFQNEELIEQPADQSTLTRRYTEQALKFITANKNKPFFLYVAHTFPHVPLFASSTFKGGSARGLYGDVVEELDWSVGQILDLLRREKLADNTFVFFTSDNGPWLIQKLAGGSAGPLREGKGSTWEGGMREPGLAWWPGRIKPGVVTPQMAGTMDLFVTGLKLAGATVPGDREIDGVDMAPILFGTGKSLRDVWFYYRGIQLYAVRKGPFKAHLITRSGYGPDPLEKHDPPLLFNLEHDLGEQFDVAKQHPDIVAGILDEIARHTARLTPAKTQLESVVAAK